MNLRNEDILQQLQKVGLTQQQTDDFMHRLHNEQNLVENELSTILNAQDNLTVRADNGGQEKRKEHTENRDQRLTSLLLKAITNQDPQLQTQIDRMPVIGRLAGLFQKYQQEQQQASTAPNPFASMQKGPSPFGRS